MNRLPLDRRAAILGLLVEGNSLRAVTRITDVSINTASKLLVDVGEACARYHDEHVRNLSVRRLPADEIWAFVGAKQKNATDEQKAAGWGDVWTWTGIDADTKLMVSYMVGPRTPPMGRYEFHEGSSPHALAAVFEQELTIDGVGLLLAISRCR